MAFLQKLGQTGQSFLELKGNETIIGRAPDCHVVLVNDGVSRRHAQIKRVKDKYYLTDLKSRNRTKLNAQELPPYVDVPLKPRDLIGICNVEFQFLDQKPLPLNKPPAGVLIEDSDTTEQSIFLDASSSISLTVRPEAKLRAVLDITRNLSRDLNIDTVAPKIVDSLMQLFPQAERAFLILTDEEQPGKLIRKAFQYHPKAVSPLKSSLQSEEPPTRISKTIVNQVLEQKKAVLFTDAGNLPTTDSIAEMRIQSIMCVPILTPDNRALGIIQLDTGGRRPFTQENLDLLLAVAGQAAIAVDNARLHGQQMRTKILEDQLVLAGDVQRQFLPRQKPRHPGYEFYAHYEATYQIGGDFYDFVPLGDDNLGIALGDVSGKGIDAALIMAKFSGDNRFFMTRERSPAASAIHLNQQFVDSGIDAKFITLGLCFLDLQTGKMTIASAGHPPIMIRKPNGDVEEYGYEVSGLPIGVDYDTQYREMVIPLLPGEVVVLYSDGVTDARNAAGELFDSKNNRRLMNRVRELSGSPDVVGRGILQSIREYSAGAQQADDITLVCFGRL